MADRFAEPDDVAVDELKRKARRRLVGAVVLALAAAIVVPMLLEREPRPLGDEVSVQIPPVDEGKFVNRLTEKSDAKPAKGAQSSEASGSKSIADAEQRVLAPPPSAAASPAIPADEKAGPNAAKPDVASATPKSEPAKSEPARSEPPKAEPPKAEPAKAGVAKSEPAKSETANVASAAPAPSGEKFVVQLAAFADDKGANALAGKLKRAGYPAYTESVQTSRGTLWRVRVGSYPSRDAASSAQSKLKGEGFNGIVAALK